MLHAEIIARKARLGVFFGAKPVDMRAFDLASETQGRSSSPGILPCRQTPIQVARAIIEEKADAHGVSVDDILSDSREQVIVNARHAAMVDVFFALGENLSLVGRLFGRDHSCALLALRKAGRWKRNAPIVGAK